MEKHLLHTISSAAWAIMPSQLSTYIPLALKVLDGTFEGKIKPESTYTYGIDPDGNEINISRDDESYEGSNIVAVHQVKGLILKYGGVCDRGMIGFVQDLQKAEANESVIAHVIDIDSGGGEATFIETVSRTIKELQKPVIAFGNGVVASAAYYIAAACDQIFLNEKTDIVGSIGSMLQWADLTEHYEKQGIKINTVYADQSTEKNQLFKKAEEGVYDLIKDKILNPIAQQFIDTVKEFRPEIDEKAYFGSEYMAGEAQEIGLIDGIATFKEVVAMAREAATTSEFFNIKTITMKFRNILAALGLASLEFRRGYASFSEAQVATLNNALAEEEAPPAAPDSEGDTVLSLEERVSALESRMTQVESRLDTLEEDQETLEEDQEALEDDIENIDERVEAQEVLTRSLGITPAAPRARGRSKGDIGNTPLTAEEKAHIRMKQLEREINSTTTYSK